MVRLTVVGGKQAGRSLDADRFPVLIGRGGGCAMVLDDPGVWGEHAAIDWVKGEGFVLRCRPETTLSVNGIAASEQRLRNGDVIALGGAKLRFGLSETRQRSFRAREWLTWLGVALLCLGQVALVYLLLP
jgi:predicted component of type VI protein secretion system